MTLPALDFLYCTHWICFSIISLILLLISGFLIKRIVKLRKVTPTPASTNFSKWKNKYEVMKLIEEYQSDIETLKENTKKLAQSERELAWREMAKLVAHEIKNPLTPLKLGVQLLKKSWEEKDPDFDQKFEKFSQSFIEQIESLSHIASEFSNFAKMPDMVLEKLNLKQILEQSVEVYRQSEQVKISFSYPPKTNFWIKADKDQLLRSFNNLIKNAIEAMPSGQQGYVQITLSLSENRANIEIKDNGAGITENLREQIFVPNFTTKSSGTGLGLAFVRQCLSSINGTVRFETEVGKGTTFFVSIPLYQ